MPEWTRETPWRQGHLLTTDAIKSLGLLHPDHPDETLVIVATHDCDLTQSPQKEPVVEVIIGRLIGEMDGNYTRAKASRTLHIPFEGEERLLAEFVITTKQTVRKEDLVGFAPLATHRLSPVNKTVFERWLASRYRRSAFPDEFERRLVHETGLANRLAKAVKPHGELISAVLFDVDEGKELAKNGPDEVYVLDVVLLHAVDPDHFAAESAANAAKEAIRAAFKAKAFDQDSGKWRYIELRHVDVVSEEAFSYRQFMLLKPWRLDYISLGADPQQPIPHE